MDQPATVNQLLQHLKELVDRGHGDMPLIYSVNDEGNAYRTIYETPELAAAESLEDHYLELLYFKEGERMTVRLNLVSP